MGREDARTISLLPMERPWAGDDSDAKFEAEVAD
jgi:hypothetical protein